MRRKPSLKQSIFVIALLGVLGIILYNTHDLLFGAPLHIATLENGMSLKDNYLMIEGTAPHAKQVSINGRNIFTDRKGSFTEPILLAPGYNVLEVGTIDRFGKSNTKRFELVLSQNGERYSLLPEDYQQ